MTYNKKVEVVGRDQQVGTLAGGCKKTSLRTGKTLQEGVRVEGTINDGGWHDQGGGGGVKDN